MTDTTTAPAAAPTAKRWIGAVELTARIIPVVTLMLPAIGAVYRWISFSAGAPLIPDVVAAKLPLIDLAVIALTGVVLVPISIVTAFVLALAAAGMIRLYLPVLSRPFTSTPPRWSWLQLLPLVVLITGVSALLTGLQPNDAGTIVADVTTVDEAAIPSGRYVLLGEDAGMLWLLPCDDQEAAIQVPASLIVVKKVVAIPEPPSTGTGGFIPAC